MGGDGVTVRAARAGELPAVMGVLDAAMLSVDAGVVEAGIERGDVIVAVDEGRVLGACLLDPGDDRVHLEAIAVRPGRRGQGIGTSLVEAAADRAGRVTAEFDADRRRFYASLGFAIEALEADRLRGVR